MCGGVVDVKMSFLETLSVVSLRVAQTEQSFLEKFVLLVPESKGDMLVAMSVTDTSYAIFSPSESSRTGLVVGEMAPSITVVRVVLSDCCPLPLSSVTSPLLPILGTVSILLEALLFLAEVLVMVDDDHVETRSGKSEVYYWHAEGSAAGRKRRIFNKKKRQAKGDSTIAYTKSIRRSKS